MGGKRLPSQRKSVFIALQHGLGKPKSRTTKLGRIGRKRKGGAREQNGRLQRILAADRDRNITVDQLVVLAQPHRRGDTDQFVESPLGRFVLLNCLDKDGKPRREIYDAGREYGDLVRHYHVAKIETKPIVSTGEGSGRGVSPEKAKWLAKEVRRLERPLRRLSMPGFLAVRRLAVYESEISSTYETPAKVILYFLAILLKKLGRRR